MDRALLMQPLLPSSDFTTAKKTSWKKERGEGGRKRRGGDKFAFFLYHQTELTNSRESFGCLGDHMHFLLSQIWAGATQKNGKMSQLPGSSFVFPLQQFWWVFLITENIFKKISPTSPSMKIVSSVADWCFLIPILNTAAFFGNNLVFAIFPEFLSKIFFFLFLLP